MDQSNGLIWAIVRLEMKVDAVIRVLEKASPGFLQLAEKELDLARQQGLLQRTWVVTRKEIEKANDGIWLKQHGLSDTEP